MKLRTEIDFDPVTPFLHVPGDPKECCIDDVCKDAMAAHALLQAMGEIEGTYADCSTAEDVRTFLHERAAEILAGWMGKTD